MIMKILKLISRLSLGIVFTFSGFVKAVDPLGTAYKFTDYFVEAFSMPGLAGLSLGLSIILNAIEFLVGICLLLNVKPRLSSIGALIFMIVFTPLTLYIAIYSPVEDCGCFGDALKLSNWATFYKNLIFLSLAVFLFIKTKGECKTYRGKIDWILAGAFLTIITIFQLYSLSRLPVIDFRPYSVGTYIPEKMVMPEGAKPDSFAIFYTLKHLETGITKKIDDVAYIEKEIWKDTLWEITATSNPVLVKKGYSPPIYNFSAYPIDITGENTLPLDDAMPNILADENFSFLVIAYDLALAENIGFQKMTGLLNYAHVKNIQVHFLTSTTSSIINYLQYIHFPAKYYNSDPITLKTIIRSNPGLVLLKKGRIIGKWHYNHVPKINEFETLLSKN